MANFCRYCGKQLENGVCDCPESQAEREKEHVTEIPVMKETHTQMDTGAAGPAASGQAAGKITVSLDAGKLGQDFLSYLKGMFRHPSTTIRNALTDADKTSQFLMLVIAALVSVIMVTVTCKDLLDGGDRFKFGIMLALAIIAIRMVYGLIVYAVAKKSSPDVDVKSVLAAFSLTLLVDSAVMLLITLFTIMTLVEIVIALTIFWLISSALYSDLVTRILLGDDTDKTVCVTMLIQIVLLVVLVFTGRGILTKLINEVMGSFGSMLW